MNLPKKESPKDFCTEIMFLWHLLSRPLGGPYRARRESWDFLWDSATPARLRPAGWLAAGCAARPSAGAG